jgi:GNAT superfamily N-acetyltransferase
MTRAALGLAARPDDRTVIVRHGTVDDVDALTALHERCSAEALERRFHTPTPRLPATVVRHLLEPPHGWSLLAVRLEGAGDGPGRVAGEDVEGEVVASICAAELEAGVLEIGVLVRDDRQGEGIGSGLVRLVAEEAAERGYHTLVAATQPDNRGVPRMVHRAGLGFVPRVVDGLLELHIPLADAEALPRPA